MPFPMANHSIPMDSSQSQQPFKLAILELASELLANANAANGNGQKQKGKEERGGLIQRRSKNFFGEAGGWPAPMTAPGDGPVSLEGM